MESELPRKKSGSRTCQFHYNYAASCNTEDLAGGRRGGEAAAERLGLLSETQTA